MTGSLNNFTGAIANSIGVPPQDDPKTFGLTYQFPVANAKTLFDFIEQNVMGLIDTIQAVYIDNDTAGKITLQVEGGSNHRIIAKPYSQGWYPLAMHDGATISFQSSVIVASNVNFLFANVAICAGPWATQ
jgi:hypothetical protein